MSESKISAAAFYDTKPHYELLDGLRGVAALMVVWYHVFEGFATSPIDQHFNHGYLAVDFFFILSGFVIGYAYDDRWKSMSKKDFFKRRLVRLHPMVIMGALLGMLTFFVQGGVQWNGTHVSFVMVLLALLLNLFLIPTVPGTAAEVRGNGEMYPLNGPSWSLFFEYIGNILYALFIHKLSTKKLKILVIVLGAALAACAIFNLSGYGHIGMGWTLADLSWVGGFVRMAFSYTMGMYLSRNFKAIRIKGAFWICSLALFAVFIVPHVGGETRLWLNGIYDSLCIIVIFPLLVYLGASGATVGKGSTKICKFLGDISYPLYMVHYPFMYLFYAWLWSKDPLLSFAETWPIAIVLFVGNIVLAYVCLKCYDEPVRRFLTRKFLNKKQ